MSIKLTTELLGHVSQINTLRIFLYIVEYKHVWCAIMLPAYLHAPGGRGDGVFSEVTRLDEGVKVEAGITGVKTFSQTCIYISY